MALYSVRSERQSCERLTYDTTPPVVPRPEDPGGAFDQFTFAKNRTRLLAHEKIGRFFAAVGGGGEVAAPTVGGALQRRRRGPLGG